MNNTLSMTDPFEARKNAQATLITAAFAAAMILLMFLLKWQLPIIPILDKDEGILVELNIPDEPPAKVLGGGGGGGNPVQATGLKGTASSPPNPGTKEDIKDIEENDEKESPAIKKPDIPKPEAKKIDENHSVVKTPPKVVVENPAPAKPKAVLGKTVGGTSTGGGAADNYDRSGGAGKGTGVGTGNGNGGGTGGGNGGGNGTGSGTGNGPRMVSGNRNVINPRPMNAGENIAGKVVAEISVSPDGKGTFIRAKGGSLMNDPQAINIVNDWLRRNRFNAINETSTVVYEFNIKMGG